MKIGIFADIHGNIFAFEKMLKLLKRQKLDLNIFCGDICGYYYFQNEVIELLKSIKNLIIVSGNHDELFLRILNDDSLGVWYRKYYGKSCDILKKNIEPENLKFLKNLPKKAIINEHKIGVFHGSPWDYLDEYVYPTSIFERFKKLQFDLVILGHTHHPMHKKIGKLHIINPGSCGQPRDFKEPCYAIFDVKTKTVKFRRFEYNPVSIIKSIKKYKEKNPYLQNILKRTNG